MQKPWLKYYDKDVPTTIDYPTIPLDQFLTRAATNHPNHTATIFGGMAGPMVLDSSLTYKQLNQIVNRFAAALQQMGIKKGERVIVMLPNCPQFVIASYALWRIGAVVVCCNPLHVAKEIRQLINDTRAGTMIIMSAFYERVKSIRRRSDPSRVIVTNIKEYFPKSLKLLFSLSKEKKEGHKIDLRGDLGTYWFQKVLKHAPAEPKAVEIEPDDIAALIYTGGTTGGSKGVKLSHRNLISNAIAINTWLKIQEAEDTIVAVMPYFHIYGLTAALNTCITNALTTILIPDPRDIDHVLKSIQKHKATFYPGVPTMFVGFNNLSDKKKFNLSSLKFAASAAAPLPPEVKQQFETITGGRMIQAYGLTECSAVTLDPIDNQRPNSIGLPLPDTTMKIVDIDTGREEMPPGEIGEIIVKGPQVMKGYWKKPGATADAIRVGPDGDSGWLYTGDIGYMDEDGFFYISDRKKDMIIAGGYNIYPADVEAVLFEHPKIQEAAVIGVPHEERGETVKAFVILKEGQTATPDEIIAFCRENMAAYRIPRLIEFRSDLPKSPIGKVLRRELREEP